MEIGTTINAEMLTPQLLKELRSEEQREGPTHWTPLQRKQQVQKGQ